MSEQSEEGRDLYHGYSVDDENQPQGFGDSLADDRGLREPLDEGYSPPDRWSSGQRFGNTAYEAEVGEALTDRLAQEEPEEDPYAWLVAGTEGRPVGGVRAGRLVAHDLGLGEGIAELPSRDDDLSPSHGASEVDAYWARQVGGRRAGRLMAYDGGPEVVALDIGIDGAGTSAEEAAMHVIDDDAWLDS